MQYQDAFPDLAGVVLEESWVLGIAPSEQAVSFQLEAVLTPDHPLYRPPTAGDQYCYLPCWLTIRSVQSPDVRLSGAPAAVDASGETDLGQVDRFESDADEVWEMEGAWGSVRVEGPQVTLRHE